MRLSQLSLIIFPVLAESRTLDPGWFTEEAEEGTVSPPVQTGFGPALGSDSPKDYFFRSVFNILNGEEGGRRDGMESRGDGLESRWDGLESRGDGLEHENENESPPAALYQQYLQKKSKKQFSTQSRCS